MLDPSHLGQEHIEDAGYDPKGEDQADNKSINLVSTYNIFLANQVPI
jgi:hypothetical protein